MKNKLPVVLLMLMLVSSSCVFANSLWNDNSSSPYTTTKAFKVGDVITIFIIENTSAAQKAGTDTGASDTLSTNFDHTIQRLAPIIDYSNQLGGSAKNTYKGSGSTTRSSNVTAKIAAVVVDVLPNGNLLIKGEHRVDVNEERQTIKISGMIRPKDVSLDNTINSYQVANASVSVSGKGPIREAEEPGWLVRMINWLF